MVTKWWIVLSPSEEISLAALTRSRESALDLDKYKFIHGMPMQVVKSGTALALALAAEGREKLMNKRRHKSLHRRDIHRR